MAQTKVKLISDGVIVQGNLHASHGITTAHIGEGSNLYYTDARVGSYLSTNSFATESYVGTQIANLVDSSPSALNTLNELAAALGDDANFSTTVTNSIALKAPLASPSFTGNSTFAANVGIGVAAHGTASLNITSTDQHIRLNNGSELGIINLDADGKLDLWAHGTDETISFRTGTGSGTVTMSVVGGKVGIGTTSPSNLLTLYKNATQGNPSSHTAANATLKIEDSANTMYLDGNSIVATGSAAFTMGNTAAADFILYTNATERMRITNAGNVGIGTASPETPLHVLTNTTDNASTMLIQNGSTGDASIKFNISGDTYSIGIDNSDSDKFKLSYGAVGTNDRIVVDTSGNVGIGTTSPSAKLEVASDTTIQNGVYTYKTGGYTSGATAINVDITVGNEGGAGNVFKIEAGFAHYFSMTYNSVAEWWCTSRGTSVVNTYILNAGTTLAGDWSASKPNTTTLRITKTAGTYGGGGKWWVKVTYVPF